MVAGFLTTAMKQLNLRLQNIVINPIGNTETMRMTTTTIMDGAEAKTTKNKHNWLYLIRKAKKQRL